MQQCAAKWGIYYEPAAFLFSCAKKGHVEHLWSVEGTCKTWRKHREPRAQNTMSAWRDVPFPPEKIASFSTGRLRNAAGDDALFYAVNEMRYG